MGTLGNAAYQLIHDAFLFTDRRLLLIDKRGVTVETAGTFDLDAELKIWLSGMSVPIQKRLGKGVDVYEVQALLSAFVAR